jgi:hypothetical protein
MAPCEHLRDGSSHGIADHDGFVQRERPHELGQVLGARFNIERGSPPPEAAVAAKVGGDSMERLPQGTEGAVPVQRRSRHPSVDEQHVGRSGRPRDLPGPRWGRRSAMHHPAVKAGRAAGRSGRLRTVSCYADFLRALRPRLGSRPELVRLMRQGALGG